LVRAADLSALSGTVVTRSATLVDTASEICPARIVVANAWGVRTAVDRGAGVSRAEVAVVAVLGGRRHTIPQIGIAADFVPDETVAIVGDAIGIGRATGRELRSAVAACAALIAACAAEISTDAAKRNVAIAPAITLKAIATFGTGWYRQVGAAITPAAGVDGAGIAVVAGDRLIRDTISE